MPAPLTVENIDIVIHCVIEMNLDHNTMKYVVRQVVPPAISEVVILYFTIEKLTKSGLEFSFIRDSEIEVPRLWKNEFSISAINPLTSERYITVSNSTMNFFMKYISSVDTSYYNYIKRIMDDMDPFD